MLEQARREREKARARLAVAGPAVYEGVVGARVAYRGITLVEPGEPVDVSDWLCDVLGLDCWAGDSARARITVELADDLASATPVSASAAALSAERRMGSRTKNWNSTTSARSMMSTSDMTPPNDQDLDRQRCWRDAFR